MSSCGAGARWAFREPLARDAEVVRASGRALRPGAAIQGGPRPSRVVPARCDSGARLSVEGTDVTESEPGRPDGQRTRGRRLQQSGGEALVRRPGGRVGALGRVWGRTSIWPAGA